VSIQEGQPGYWQQKGTELYRQQTPEDRQVQLDVMRILAEPDQPACNREWAEGWLAGRAKETAYRG
jgi:hypothetical protein